jgi:hypothetical protein
MTPLKNTLKRELVIDKQAFVVTLSTESLKLTAKGKRKGLEIQWRDLVSGEAALAAALNASVGKFGPTGARTRTSPRARKA